ncbi:hypothetical protein PGT21_014304 [Puccinia graminis f. sp. tritici]|uniref:Uncharacterized protein n=1 Tax=Puccinia graminis f. sp. tritici TaxID=56615 RepID=A0A5B0MA27_PUCGR|nr:hypothetical protein PGT21_014304 [Puccinia graminis f. sp. tritici]
MNAHQLTLGQHTPDPVLVGFSHLMTKYQPVFFVRWRDVADSSEEASSSLSKDEQLKSLQDLLDSMTHCLLPQLKDQLRTLSDLLFPPNFWKQPEITRKLILETQSEIENTIDQIKSIIATLCPAPTGSMISKPTHTQTEDQDLEALKSYRLQRLKSKFNEGLLYHVNLLFTQAHILFQQIKLVPDKVRPNEFDGWTCREDFAKRVRLASKTINSIIETSECSELDLVQQQWAVDLQNIDETMEEIASLIARSSAPKRSPDELENRLEFINSNNTDTNPNRAMRTWVIPLAKSSLRIIKIGRLYFKKVLRTAGKMNGKRFTSMNLKQIESLAEAANLAHENLADLLVLFQKAANPHGFGPENRAEFSIRALRFSSHVNSAKSLVLKYLFPLISDIDPSESLVYCTAWFNTWSNMFFGATMRFECI